jgi:hypothetical protein
MGAVAKGQVQLPAAILSHFQVTGGKQSTIMLPGCIKNMHEALQKHTDPLRTAGEIAGREGILDGLAGRLSSDGGVDVGSHTHITHLKWADHQGTICTVIRAGA